MPGEASTKRKRAYEYLNERFHEEGCDRGCGKEIASRIANKQRKMCGEAKNQKQDQKRDGTADRGLPIRGCRHLMAVRVKPRPANLSRPDVKRVAAYERGHDNRKMLLEELDKRAM